MRFTRDGAEISRDQWRLDKGVGELQSFLMINIGDLRHRQSSVL
jgi:hypothetical protein